MKGIHYCILRAIISLYNICNSQNAGGQVNERACHQHVSPTIEISKRGCEWLWRQGVGMFETQKRICKPLHCYIRSQALDSFFFLDGLISKGKRAGGESGGASVSSTSNRYVGWSVRRSR